MPNLVETIEQIRRFDRLADGWSYGEGCAFSAQTIKDAEDLAVRASALGFELMDAFPGLSGEVLVTLYAAPHYYELTIEPDKGITLMQEHKQAETFYAEYPSSLAALKQLGELASSHLASLPFASRYATTHQGY